MSPFCSESKAPASPLFRVGTLVYNRQQLVALFFWLMWNDFSITLLEQIGSKLNNVLLLDQGATYTQLAILGSVGSLLMLWINPLVSTWSDRHRGKHGRRRPFLFAAAPPFALLLAAIPFMPAVYQYLLRFPVVAALAPHLPMKGPVVLLGIWIILSGVFNSAVLAIFSYLYWDVVPESHMGRFQSLSKVVTLTAGLIWSFFIFGLAEHHIEAVYVGTAAFSVAVYLLSVWRIREGEYPPPDEHKKGGIFAPVRAYFVECYSQSYYLWIFAGSCLNQISGQGGHFQWYYAHYDLKMNLATIGWAEGWANMVTTGFGIACGFALGSLTDRLKPVRLMGPIYLLMALVKAVSFFFVFDKWSYLISSSAFSMLIFAQGVAYGAFVIEVFPREKLGQFCSAQLLFYQVVLTPVGPLIGMFFDRIHFNRFGFIWSGVFYVLTGLFYIKVFYNWKERHGHSPVPHAG